MFDLLKPFQALHITFTVNWDSPAKRLYDLRQSDDIDLIQSRWKVCINRDKF